MRRLERPALWGLIASKLVGGWGLQWDIQWHITIGRDSFWIAPHVMTYAGVAATVLLSFGVLAWRTFVAPAGHTVRVFGLRGTPGFHFAAWAIALTVLAAPIDDLWHRLFGLDVTLWSPPHLLGLVGAALNSLACVLIAREVFAPGRARLLAMLLTGAMFYGGVAIVLQPTFRLAYLYGGLWFFGYVLLGVLLLPLALVPATRLSGARWLALGLLVTLSAVDWVGLQLARAGFDILQPVSNIEEAVARDPTSGIAIAREMARKNRSAPARPPLVLRLVGFIPVLILGLADVRRRPGLATLAWAVALFVVWTAYLSRSAAPMAPHWVTALAAFALTLAAALAGGAVATRLSRALERSATA